MFNKSALVALTIALSATAFTASASNQLALSLGVEPGVYTTSDLIRLADAREDNDKLIESTIIHKAEATARGVTFATPSNDVIIAAFDKTLSDGDGNARDSKAFAAQVNGENPVSAETVAFVQDHLARVGSER